MNIVALILARSGSVRLKNKHLKALGTKKLIEWTFELSNNKYLKISDFVLSTDDSKILNLSKKYPIISFGLRPAYLAKSETSSYQAAKHIIKIYEKKIDKIDIIILLQPTSPFRNIRKINQSIDLFVNLKHNINIISVVKKNNGSKFNGNFYITSKNILFKEKTFVTKNFIPISLNTKYSIDIDTIKDLNTAKREL